MCVCVCIMYVCILLISLCIIVFPVISSLVNTSGAVPDRRLGNVIVEPSGTLNVLISALVESDPCPMVAWRFEGRDPAVRTEEFILNSPCSDPEESSPYNFTLTIANLTSNTSGVYSADFTVQNTVVPLPPLFVTVPGVSHVKSTSLVCVCVCVCVCWD